MGLYQCDKCGCVDNTSVSKCSVPEANYFIHGAQLTECRQKLGLKDDQKLGRYCSACCPLQGKWHGQFDRIFLPPGEFETGPTGNLRHKKTHDEDFMKYAIRIIPKTEKF